MQLEQQVTSRELSEKLKALGFRQDCYFQWVKRRGEWLLWDETQHSDYETGIESNWLAAPTASELLDVMPPSVSIEDVSYHLEILKDEVRYLVRYASKGWIGEAYYGTANRNLANAAAARLIWLAENGHVKFGDK